MCVFTTLTSIGGWARGRLGAWALEVLGESVTSPTTKAPKRLSAQPGRELRPPLVRERLHRQDPLQRLARGPFVRVDTVDLPDRNAGGVRMDQLHFRPRLGHPLFDDPAVPPAPPETPDEGDRVGVAEPSGEGHAGDAGGTAVAPQVLLLISDEAELREAHRSRDGMLPDRGPLDLVGVGAVLD